MTETMTEAEAGRAQPPYTGRYGKAVHSPAKCCATVTTSQGLSTYFNQCTRKPKVFYGELGYCGQHDPVAVKEQRDSKYAAWQAESARNNARYAETKRMEALKVDALAAIKEIAAGHNDPRTLATAILAKHGEEPK